MKCSDICSLISDYLDNELEEELRDTMSLHIEHCKKCKVFLHTVEETLFFSREVYKTEKVPDIVINKIYYEIRIKFGEKKRKK